MPYLETKKVPQNEKAVLLGINNLPEVLQKFLLQFLNFQEILGIFQLPALKARFYNMVYPLIHIAPFLKIERGPNYNIRPTDYCLSIDDADSNGMIHYVIRFQDRPLKPKQLLSKSVNWSDIKNEYKEEDPIAKKQQIEQYILNKNKEQIKKIVLREIPESSLHTFFTIMSVLGPFTFTFSVSRKSTP